ncbi:hypothetical protein ACROYT_G004889 [Oculina patagonica]
MGGGIPAKKTSKEYLPSMRERKKWKNKKQNLKEGDVALVAEPNQLGGEWPLVKIVLNDRGRCEMVGAVTVRIQTGVYKRLITKLCLTFLSRNDISSLSYSLFNALTNLYHLDISGNKISLLPDGVFAPLKNLRRLLFLTGVVAAVGFDPWVLGLQLDILPPVSFNRPTPLRYSPTADLVFKLTKKLQRGEFSASSRVTAFMSTLSRYSVHLRHIAGVENLPSDYASRHPKECLDSSCQICKFIFELDVSVIGSLSVSDVLQGSVKMPFTSRAAWQATQLECHHLRRTHSHLSQGTRPSKKATNIIDVKRYLKDVVIAADGLLVVRDHQPFQPPRERLFVPRSVLDGLLTSLHIHFSHPSKYQTKRLFTRYFFALDVDKAIDLVSSSCHTCQSLKSIPKHFQPQSCKEAPRSIGVSFAADFARRHRQLILVLRETVSSYTLTTLIKSEKQEDLRNAIIVLCSQLRSLQDGSTTVRVDPAPGFCALANDPILLSQGISLEIGRVKNPNKNTVAERAIEELSLELFNLSPEGGPVSDVTLALATANTNSRIRRDGLWAREV